MKYDFRCSICGKFFKLNQINKSVITGFIPDSAFTSEQTWFYHKKCNSKK